jgi:hypothetical protein
MSSNGNVYLNSSYSGNRDTFTISPINPEKLEFPKHLAPHVGLCKERIGWMKHQGCKYVGKKTKLRWINEFLEVKGAVPASSGKKQRHPH